MPGWIPVCRQGRVCSDKKGHFRTRRVSARRGTFRNARRFGTAFGRFGTAGVPERLLAFRDGFWAFWHGFLPFRNAGRSGMGGGVPGTAARRSGMAKTRSGTHTRRPGTRFAVPERVLVFRGGNRRSRAGARRPRTASERAGTASGVPAREASIRSARRTLSPSQHPHSQRM